MTGKLTVRGGTGGVAARTDDMRHHARLLDGSGDTVREVAGTAAAAAEPTLLLRTGPFAPASAATAEWALLGAAGRITGLAVATELAADRLRLVAAAVHAADAWPRAARERVARELAPVTVLVGLGAAALTGLGGAAAGTVEGALARTPWVDGPVEPWSEHALDGAVDGWTALLHAAPWLVDGVVDAGPALVEDLLWGGFQVTPGQQVVTREALLTSLLAVASRFGVLQDTAVRHERLEHPPTTAAPRDLGEVVDLQSALMERTRDDASSSRLGVLRVRRDDGSTGWIVLVPGTQEWTLTAQADPSDLVTNLHLSPTGDAALLDAIADVLHDAGVGAEDTVMLAGHSQGGIAATAFARQAQERGFTVTHVFTQGSPLQNLPLPPEVQGLFVEHDEDIVPRTDAGPNLALPNQTTVTGPSHAPVDEGPIRPHSLLLYRDTVGEALSLGAPSVDRFAEEVRQLYLDGTVTQLEYRLVRDQDRDPASTPP